MVFNGVFFPVFFFPVFFLFFNGCLLFFWCFWRFFPVFFWCLFFFFFSPVWGVNMNARARFQTQPFASSLKS